MSGPTVVVELLGLPRHKAGRSELSVAGRTVTDVLEAVGCECPGLRPLISAGRLNPVYLLSWDGDRFVTDLAEPVIVGARLLILGADAGG